MKRSLLSCIAVGVLTTTAATSVYASTEWEDKAKDAWIDGKAEASLLFNTHLNSFDINTDVKDGVVILTGKVDSRIDKKLAEELVAGIDGVSEVDNQLSVISMDDDEDVTAEKPVSQELKDAKIATVVKSKLLMDSDISGLDIDVDVTKGHVKLKGSVESESARALAIEIAKNTSDVESVDDELTIEESE
ncbi:Osmotically-inducible protein OsmY, contains BON domain [Marisediminitalea aggregata]|jgi:osmotically-inducible protein OsmY|uniref:Osmotically-inducible protein OsmY, contains BON domain n=1 Tax=Marisediminitalea aggregata TaxID=634436 RepID=A0A1M5JFM0_9ALTE|nr:BON domain-containing protein [Marisediminitalea aggregata]MAH55725.1 BON domain-containing protein [Aestuariibacter sp.]MAP23721.1 BON domain-containing protein [Alteromonadaceae bacterium]MEC7824939.1 BON domain-containing protein [Pseudomonadota bacterium]BBO27352.1 transporter [Alteromonas sp. I4]MAX43545.1 BON domain-containing protein [Alteromonadaceae bacterium]|tara:strand:- start:2769 stop:3338 length:570 start_codon:yes stop_codon:yes gene_type:complete